MKELVYQYLRTVPRGKVVTYGQIAAHVGHPRAARAVGNILHRNPDGERTPCYKAVNRDGRLSPHYAFGGLNGQRERLEREGIRVINGRVDLAVCGLTDDDQNRICETRGNCVSREREASLVCRAPHTATRLDEHLIYAILSVVEEIPEGRVCTYGHIASLIGKDRNARLVGRVLSTADRYGNYPCHRVVNAQGRTAPGWREQRQLLEREGVAFLPTGCVNMKAHLWRGE